jgi:cell division protein FtsQ
MKLGSKRGSAVLEAPEETYALRTSIAESPEIREPAPAGAFQRAAALAAGRSQPAEDDEPYVPRRGGVTFKLRTAIPRGLAGRIIVGSAALFVLGVALVSVVGLRKYLLHDDRFEVATSSEIEIQGNEHLTRAQILSVFGADLERNIFKVPLAERRSDLERLPWVAHATVMRLLPNHLRIAVTERVPVAFVRQGTELGLVDANGVLLDMPAQSAGDPHYSFPVLTGLNAADPLSVRAARMAVYAKFMKDLDATGEKLTQSLSEVDVSNPEDVKAVVPSGANDILVHFGDENFVDRFHEFKQHLPEWLTQYPKLASADMRYERQVVLEMAAGSAVPTNSAPAAAPEITTTAAEPVAAATPVSSAPPPPAKSTTSKTVPVAKAVSAKAPPAAKSATARASAAKLMQAKLAQARAVATVVAPPASKPVAAKHVLGSGSTGQ